MVADLFWTKDAITIGSCLKFVIHSYVKSVQDKNLQLMQCLQNILAVACQYMNLQEKFKFRNKLKESLIDCFQTIIMELEVSQDRDFFVLLSLLKPTWLSMAINLRLLNDQEIRTDEMLSLRKVLRQLSEKTIIQNNGKENVGQQSKTPVRTRGASARIDVTKKNKYGNKT